MEQTQQPSAKRQTAIKIWIKDILASKYIKAQGEWDPNYILTPHEKEVSRVSLMGIVVADDSNESNTILTIDDSSGKISLRSFEKIPQEFNLGQIVLVIGRPREFGNELYVMPEIIKVLENKNWLELRKLELEKLYGHMPSIEPREEVVMVEKTPNPEEVASEVPQKQEVIEESVEPIEEPVNEEPKTKENLAYEDLMDEIKKEQDAAKEEASQPSEKPFDKIMDTIRSIDSGDGADIDEVISESGIEESKAESIINNLLMDGEAFEIKPGKLKLLD